MSHLDNYLMRKNFMAGVFGGRTYDVYNLSEIDIDCLLQDLDNELSPENLSCDGELQGKSLAMKKSALENAMKELLAMTEKVA
jgi:hypothetical protein